jgi:hypothetical protein
MAARQIVYMAVFLCSLFCSRMASAELIIVCNSATSLSAEEIFDVFLGGKQFSNGIKLIPVDNASVQEEFLAKVLRMSSTKYATLWTKKAFRDGIRQPALKIRDEDVLEHVRRTPGGIGYVRSHPSGVSIVKRY